jgi:hypothetical protein
MRTETQCLRVVATIALAVLTVLSIRSHAEGFERIRPQSNLLADAIESGVQRSATFRSIVERLERSDVIVHLTCSRFPSGLIAGRTLLASATPTVRYIRVQILCQQLEPELVAIVAHELQHVLEIASTPSVVDEDSLARLFKTIGFATCLAPVSERYETMAAIEIGARARLEFLRHSESTAESRRQTAQSGERRSGSLLSRTSSRSE